MTKQLLAILAFLTVSTYSLIGFAQTNIYRYQITGTVTSTADPAPLPFVKVLVTANDKIIQTTLTDNDGKFIVNALAPAAYQLTFTSIDYTTKKINVAVNATIKEPYILDIGKVLLNVLTNAVKEVEITAGRPILKQEIDRISYDLQADPESKGSNVLNMLKKVPYVSVDGNNDILLKGNSDYRIFINGRPSTMVERDPKTILSSMPASTIDKIEVITSPSSKYDAEGVSGIINIITRKSISNGYNGSINMNGRFPVGGPSLGGSFAWKQNKFGVSIFGGGSNNQSPETNNFKSLQGIGSSTLLTQNNIQHNRGNSGYIGSEMSYEIDSLNLLSIAVNTSASRSHAFSNLNSQLNNQGAMLQQYKLASDNLNNRGGWDGSINYQLGFKGNKNHLLTFSYQYSTNNTAQNGNQNFSDQLNYTQPNYSQLNNGTYNEHTAQVDYVIPLKKVTIEAGIKGIQRNNASNFIFSSIDAVTGDYVIDPTQSNIYSNDQSIYGAYNSFKFNLGKWGIRGGIRMERTVVHANFLSSGTLLNQSQTNFPVNLLVNRSMANGDNLQFAFQQRIQRAGINKLNPFVDRSNPNFEIAGNPDLDPALLNTAKVEYSRFKKLSVSVSSEFNYSNNLFVPVDTYNATTKITRSTFQNVGKAWGVSLNTNLRYPITKVFNVSLNARAEVIKLNTLINLASAKYTIYMYNAAFFTDYRFKNNWRANANANYNGPRVTTVQGRRNGYFGTSFSVSKDILDNKLTLNATVNNPFMKYRKSENTSTDPNFIQSNIDYQYFRTTSFSINYKFGKLKDGIKKNKRGIRNDDLSN